MAVNWPGTLPQIIDTNGFSVKFGKTTIRTQMDAGLDKVRSRFTDGIDVYTVSMTFQYGQLDDFYDFYKTSLNNGATSFNFIDPITDETREFRFLDEPDLRPLSDSGLVYQITMQWEKLP